MKRICFILSCVSALAYGKVFVAPKLTENEQQKYKEFLFYKHFPGYEYTIALNGEHDLCKTIDKLREMFDLNIAVETGAFYGSSTNFFSTMFEEVHTFENNPKFIAYTEKRFKDTANIVIHKENSGTGMDGLLKDLAGNRIFFYLDAHWGNYWPLRDEIKQITKYFKDDCIIMIDDVKVPGYPQIGFDQYGKHVCSYEYISHLLGDLFTSHKVYYFVTEKMHRGKLLLVPDSYTDGRELVLEDFR